MRKLRRRGARLCCQVFGWLCETFLESTHALLFLKDELVPAVALSISEARATPPLPVIPSGPFWHLSAGGGECLQLRFVLPLQEQSAFLQCQKEPLQSSAFDECSPAGTPQLPRIYECLIHGSVEVQVKSKVFRRPTKRRQRSALACWVYCFHENISSADGCYEQSPQT